jgi:hypothetical protein
MSYTKELDRLADKAVIEAIDEIYRICEWTLSGDEVTQLLEDTDINKAHSYLMNLVVSKLANKLLIDKL